MVIYTLETIPDSLKRKKERWLSERNKWWETAKRDEEYYYNDVDDTKTNFTKDQLRNIYEKGGAVPVSLNFIHPIVNHKLAIMTKTKPTFKIVALDQRGKPYAHVLDKLVKHIMYKSEALGEEEETIKNMLVLGMGITTFEEEPVYQMGMLPLRYRNLHPLEVILDANAKRRNLTDMRGYFVEKELSEEEFYHYYDNLLNEINRRREIEGLDRVDMDYFTTALSTNNERVRNITDLIEKTVLVTEYYDKVRTRMYYIKDIDSGRTVKVFAENLDPEAVGILETAEYFEDNIFVRRNLFWGNYMVLSEVLPITDFMIKVKFFEWGGRPYRSYGVIHFIREMQHTIDKAIQQMLYNGMLINNAGYIVPEGSIDDTNRANWEQYGGKAGMLKEYKIVNIEGNILKPEREQILQLSPFYPQLIDMMRASMEYSSGINPIVQGNPNIARIDVFSTVQQYQNAAIERIALALNHIITANEQLGNVLTEYLLNILTPDTVYILLDENNKIDEVEVTREMIENSQMVKYILLSIQGELLPSQKVAQSIEMFKIAQTTTDPYAREIYIRKAFELSDIRNFDELSEELNTVANLQQQLQQMQQQVERDKELLKQYENRALLAEYNEKLAKLILQTVSSINKKLLTAEDINSINTENQQLMIDELSKLNEKLLESLNQKEQNNT